MEGQVRIGKVEQVRGSDRKARVRFPDVDMLSDWLSVMRFGVNWMPAVGNTVICLYLDGFNSDGIILGVLTS